MLSSPPYVSGFFAYRDTAQQMLDRTWEVVKFLTVVYDIHDEYDTSTGLFTAKKEGHYLCDWSVTSENATFTDGETWTANLVKNGATNPSVGNIFHGFRVAAQGTQTIYATSNGSVVIPLDAADTVAVELYHIQDGTLYTHASGHYNYFSVRKIGLS
jgi:hypothetical protein